MHTNILNSRTPKMRPVGSLLGNISSTFPAAKFGRLHYRGLERCKTMTIAKSKSKRNGKFNNRIPQTEAAKSEIRWWKKMWTIFIMARLYQTLISVVMLFGSKALAKSLTKVLTKVLTDNSIAVACMNKFGICWSITRIRFSNKRDMEVIL